MRRCQRLPEVTHPVDSTRPAEAVSSPVPGGLRRKQPTEAGAEIAASCLIDAEVAVDLPGRHMLDVVEPLLALGGDEVLEEMLAEELAHQRVFFQLVQRLAQVAR